MRSPARTTAAFVGIAIALLAGDAGAFCRSTTCKGADCRKDEHGCPIDGVPVAWDRGCVGFSANLSGTSMLTEDEWMEALRNAMHAWQEVDCGGGQHPSIQVVELRPSTCSKTEYNAQGPNVNVIYFTDDGWTPTATSDLDATLAVTTTHFNSEGTILDADMSINSARHDFSVASQPGGGDQDLPSVLLHEAGHFLGIAHSDKEDASMFFEYAAGTTKRTLTKDDIAAICTAYPPGRDVGPCDPTPAGGFAPSCDPAATVGCEVAPPRTDSAGIAFPIAALGAAGAVVARAISNRRRRS